MRVYLDNAATTPILPEVIESMTNCLKNNFGNPSSSHFFGRQSKALLETSRRTISNLLNCSPSEVIFTSGGTEADNMVFNTAIHSLKIKHIITSKIEHHAVLHTAEYLAKEFNIKISFVQLDEKGNVNLTDLERLLQLENKALVSLMHANNEIATLLPIKLVSELCLKYDAYFHSDTVQSLGHYPFDLQDLKIDFLSCAAHKFHGPKGVGFIYINKRIKTQALLLGGSQERGFRGGTENLTGIIGLSKAFELAHDGIEVHQNYVQELKTYFISELKKLFSDVSFYGEIEPTKSLYTVLNVCLPENQGSSMLLFTLDLKGVACSGGSACSSGSAKISHVLEGIGANTTRPNVRFSFSRFTTKEEINFTLIQLKEIYKL